VAEADAGDLGGVVAGREHVAERQQQPRVGVPQRERDDDQRAVRVRHPQRLALRAVVAGLGEDAAVHAGGLQAVDAVFARPVGPGERRDHQVAGPHGTHVGAHVLDHAEELVPDPGARHALPVSPVGPEVGAADAGGDHPDDGVGGQLDLGVGHLLDPDVARSFEDGGTHP
jgi:hypothetical protein